MHYLPDTTDEESLLERYWPDGFKPIIRDIVQTILGKHINDVDLAHIYRRHYTDLFPDVGSLRRNLINSAMIGAENGVDEGFELIYDAFLKEIPLPESYIRMHPVWPFIISLKDRCRIKKAIEQEYFNDDGFIYAYNDGYKSQFTRFNSFINAVADLMTNSTINGVNVTLEKYYNAFIHGWPLPAMRRNPRRLKTW